MSRDKYAIMWLFEENESLYNNFHSNLTAKTFSNIDEVKWMKSFENHGYKTISNCFSKKLPKLAKLYELTGRPPLFQVPRFLNCNEMAVTIFSS